MMTMKFHNLSESSYDGKLMSAEIYSNKQTNRDSKRYRGEAEGRQAVISLRRGGEYESIVS